MEGAVSAAIVVCSWETGRDGIPVAAEELLTLARKVSAGAALDWLVLGPLPQGATEVGGRHGVREIDHLEDDKLASFPPDACTEALAQYCARRSPRVLLLAQTFDARLIAPRVAARAGAGVVMNAVDLGVDGSGTLTVTASAYGGNTRVVYALARAQPCVIGALGEVLVAEPARVPTSPAIRRIPVDLSRVEERVRVTERAEMTGPRLEDAQIIVAGGRGLGSKENFRLVEELADALGGMAGASRPIVDDGWADSSRQVGLTGKITRPTLYVAAGISGASQHMAGCAAAKTLVAINRDPDAAIFRYARYGIVGDCLEVLPAITRIVRSTG
ncbi:MAG: electron transfer flavoprotein subunit alpha/FixB family protein [Candidatus Binatia bacterium]